MKAPKKHYEHDDCGGCIFLGPLRDGDDIYDLYYCPQNDVPTVIARYGNEGHEYMSGIPSPEVKSNFNLPLLSTINPLIVAKARAAARGFRLRPKWRW